MIIKVPVSELTVGERTEDSIVNLRKEVVIGRISQAEAKKMFPDDTVISVERHYAEYDVPQASLEALIASPLSNSRN